MTAQKYRMKETEGREQRSRIFQVFLTYVRLKDWTALGIIVTALHEH